MRIEILDQNTINKIAAGEVIERPKSIVKELVENSIDAGATSITVEIDKECSIIKIIDNGYGIEKEDIKKAILRHATSKIKNEDDLFSIMTLGFRGEALSSISEIAEFEILTRTKDSECGYRAIYKGGENLLFEEVAINVGTTIIISDIFFNVPARKKFLKRASTEISYITELMTRLAISNSNISIKYVIDGKEKLKTIGNSNLLDTIYSVYGKDIATNLVEVSENYKDIDICGFISNGNISRGNRNYMNYFVNGRYITSETINMAILEGFKGIMMVNKFPFTVLYINIDSENIDVNVHPTKQEIRFVNKDDIFRAVNYAIKKAFATYNRLDLHISKDNNTKKLDINDTVNKNEDILKINVNSNTLKNEDIQKFNVNSDFDNDKILLKNNDLNNNLENKINIISKSNEIIEENKLINIKKDKILENINNRVQDNFFEKINFEKEELKDEKFEYKLEEESTIYNMIFGDIKNKIMVDFTKYRYVGQIFNTYIILEYNNEVLLIDQHAAHEKVIFENILKSDGKNSQLLLTPIILTIDEDKKKKLLESKLDKLGFIIEELNEDIIIRGVPNSIYKTDSKDLLDDIINNLDNTKIGLELIEKNAATIACKSAIKAGHKIKEQEVMQLLAGLSMCENPYNCPHGRPVIIKITNDELEKKFKRKV